MTKIKIIKHHSRNSKGYYRIGDIGIVQYMRRPHAPDSDRYKAFGDQAYYVDFNQPENEQIEGEGFWWVSTGEFKEVPNV